MTRIALVSIGAADDATTWSGIPYHIKAALQGMGVDVVDVSPLRVPAAALRHRAFVLARRLGADYRYERDASSIRSFGREATRRVRAAEPDAVIATSVLPVAGMQLDVPVGVWSDATVENLERTYPEFGRVPRWQRRNGWAAERSAMAVAGVLAFASPWAAESAVSSFGAEEAKVLIAPFGSSLEPDPGFDLAAALRRRDPAVCRLVWIGADWERKRGRFCVDVAASLVERGRDVRLTMVGARPGHRDQLPDFVTHLGFVDKRDAGGRERLSELLAAAHFTLLPSTAECFGIAIAEGNAHGVPCLASRVGGIPGAIDDGANGWMLDPDAPAGAYADRIEDLMVHRDAYDRLAEASLSAWRERLNWSASCAALVSRLLPDGPRG